MDHIEVTFNLSNSKKEFCFCSFIWKTETFFGIVIFGVVGKNCIVKNEKYIVFPKSKYVNLNIVIFMHNFFKWQSQKKALNRSTDQQPHNQSKFKC